jgi:hypothetical protein
MLLRSRRRAGRGEQRKDDKTGTQSNAMADAAHGAPPRKNFTTLSVVVRHPSRQPPSWLLERYESKRSADFPVET